MRVCVHVPEREREGGTGAVWSVCLFVFVSGSRLLQSAPFSCDGLFVRLRHKIIRLVAVRL